MTILYTVKCDMCDNTHEMDTIVDPSLLVHNLPPSWVVVCSLDLPAKYWLYFCSKDCFKSNFHEGVTPTPEPQEQPACNARRFLLVDEHANITEGVKWGNGSVQLEEHLTGTEGYTTSALYGDWDEFKERFPGCGVQWIDQEVSK